jgi:peptidoglycan/LPS O-acetylase OafA/YrhL
MKSDILWSEWSIMEPDQLIPQRGNRYPLYATGAGRPYAAVVTPGRMGRARSLDGLRGIAALVVVIDHSLLGFPRLADAIAGKTASDTGIWAWLVFSPLHIFWDGTAAVYLFFILSGYVLTASATGSATPWRAYYPARLLRLYLPTIGAIAVAALLFFAVPHLNRPGASWWMNSHAQTVTASTVGRDVLLLGGTDYLDSPLWSLRWEVIFSIMLPLFVLGAVFAGRMWWLALIGLLALSFVGEEKPWLQGAVFYLPIFAIGCVLAAQRDRITEWLSRLPRWRGRKGYVVVAIVCLLSFPWMLSGFGFNSNLDQNAAVIAQLAACVILVGMAVWNDAAKQPLERPVPQWLGSRSFSLYLIHEPLVVAIAMVLPVGLAGITPLLAIPAAIVGCELFFRAVEHPSHLLSRRVGRAIGSQTRPSGVEADTISAARGETLPSVRP